MIPVSSLILKILKLFEWKGKQHRVLEPSCLERSVVRDIALLALGRTEMPPKFGANFFQVRLYYIVSSYGPSCSYSPVSFSADFHISPTDFTTLEVIKGSVGEGLSSVTSSG